MGVRLRVMHLRLGQVYHLGPVVQVERWEGGQEQEMVVIVKLAILHPMTFLRLEAKAKPKARRTLTTRIHRPLDLTDSSIPRINQPSSSHNIDKIC